MLCTCGGCFWSSIWNRIGWISFNLCIFISTSSINSYTPQSARTTSSRSKLSVKQYSYDEMRHAEDSCRRGTISIVSINFSRLENCDANIRVIIAQNNSCMRNSSPTCLPSIQLSFYCSCQLPHTKTPYFKCNNLLHLSKFWTKIAEARFAWTCVASEVAIIRSA
jgi:hypothetical protein